MRESIARENKKHRLTLKLLKIKEGFDVDFFHALTISSGKYCSYKFVKVVEENGLTGLSFTKAKLDFRNMLLGNKAI